MRPETRRRFDRLVWKGRLGIGAAIILGLAVVGTGYAYVYWPDPVVGTRAVSGVVTDGTRRQGEDRASYVIWATLDDGRRVTIVQPPLAVLQHGHAIIEERRHRSGRLSYRWVGTTSD
jgi:hypothetical protein